MAATALPVRDRPRVPAGATGEPVLVKALLTAVAAAFLALFLVVPLLAVSTQALEKGWAAYLAALREPMAVSALKLTLLTAAFAVPLNLLFGVAAAWSIARFDFPARTPSSPFIDLPFVPLHVEILYNEYNFQAAFAAASLLAFLALVTLVAKTVVEWCSAEARPPGTEEGEVD
jgi:ABC-type sulfate transport system permease subunit